MIYAIGFAISPSDAWVFHPTSGLIDGLFLDVSFRDLAFWFPRMTWSEIASAAGAFLCLRLACDWLERKVIGLLKQPALIILEALCPGFTNRMCLWRAKR